MSSNKNYKMTDDDKEIVSKLLLDLATEIDLHYDDEDMFALTASFNIIKDGCALLQRLDYPVHESVNKVLERFNRAHN